MKRGKWIAEGIDFDCTTASDLTRCPSCKRGFPPQWKAETVRQAMRLRESLQELVELVEWADKNKDTISADSIAMDRARDALKG